MQMLIRAHFSKQFLIVLFIGSLALTGCGGQTQAAPSATPLTASTEIPSASPLPTAVPTQPLATDAPTAEAVPTLTVSPSPTQLPPTATVTATEVPLPEPDAIAADPLGALGDPDWSDTFDTAENWKLYDNDCFMSSIADGRLEMTGLTQNICWLLTEPEPQNFYLEVTTDASECPAGAEFGLYFRGPESSSGYTYTLSCLIKVLMVARDGQAGTKSTLVDEPVDPELAWPTWENRLGVLAVGGRYRLYVNGVFLTEVEDEQFTGPGQIGLVVRGGAMNLTHTAWFDNLAYWDLPAETGTGNP
jgi:hypothetical protein